MCNKYCRTKRLIWEFGRNQWQRLARATSIFVLATVFVIYALQAKGGYVAFDWGYFRISAASGALFFIIFPDKRIPPTPLRLNYLLYENRAPHPLLDTGLPRIVPAFGTSALVVPFWAVTGLCGVTCILVWKFTKRKTMDGNCCEVCSYSLVGNTSGICPECGMQISKEQRQVTEKASST